MMMDQSIFLCTHTFVVCLHCLFTFTCSSSTKSIVKALKRIIHRNNTLLTVNMSIMTNVPFAFFWKWNPKCPNVQSVRCSSSFSSVHFIVEAGAGHWRIRRKITTRSHNLSRTPESSMTTTGALTKFKISGKYWTNDDLQCYQVSLTLFCFIYM